MPLLLGIDTGGTYTDAVLFDPKNGVLASAKALTTKHNLAIGIGEAVEAVLPVERGEIALISLSTTLATERPPLFGAAVKSFDAARAARTIFQDPAPSTERSGRNRSGTPRPGHALRRRRTAWRGRAR